MQRSLGSASIQHAFVRRRQSQIFASIVEAVTVDMVRQKLTEPLAGDYAEHTLNDYAMS